MAVQKLTGGHKEVGEASALPDIQKFKADDYNSLYDKFNNNADELTATNSNVAGKPSTNTVQNIAWGVFAEVNDSTFLANPGYFASAIYNGNVEGAMLNPATYPAQRITVVNNCQNNVDEVVLQAGGGNSWFNEGGVLTESITITQLRGVKLTSDKKHWLVERL